MEELLLCNSPLAAMPYYIEELSIHIYSLEELCYLMEHSMFLPEEGFFEENFLRWMEQEIGQRELADRLREAVKKGQKTWQYLELIFQETGYLKKEAVQKIQTQLQQLQNKTIFERRKLRADRYLENKRYVNAISENRRLLTMEEECKKNPVICGSIWHNQGTAFARLFLFEQAKECFLEAYKRSMKRESMYAAITACLYLGAEEELNKLVFKYGISEAEVASLREEWINVGSCNLVLEFESELNALFETDSKTAERKQKLVQLLEEWKKEYQKNCG